MKANVFILYLLLFIVIGCTSQQNDQPTQQQKEQIKNEVKTIYDSLITSANKPNMNGFLQYYSPELVAVFDTVFVDYQTYENAVLNFSKANVSLKWTTFQFESIVLTKDFVITTWIGMLEQLLESGDQIITNPRKYINVLKKVDGQWKVIFENGSGIPVRVKADKK